MSNDMNTPSTGHADRTCLNCRHWSDLIARKPPGSWEVEALCLQPKSMNYCSHIVGRETCKHFTAGTPVDGRAGRQRATTLEAPPMKQHRDFLNHPGSYNVSRDSRSAAEHANPFEGPGPSPTPGRVTATLIVVCICAFVAWHWFR